MFKKILFLAMIALSSSSMSVADEPKTATPDEMVQYFHHVRKLTTEVLARNDAITFSQYAMWLDTAADYIDRRPTLGIDARLVANAMDSATRLRNVAASFRDIGLISSVARNQGYYNCFAQPQYFGHGYYWRYYISYYCKYHQDLSQRRMAMRDASRFKTEQIIEDRQTSAELARVLTNEYQVEF